MTSANVDSEKRLIKELTEKIQCYKKEKELDKDRESALSHRIRQTEMVIEGLKNQIEKKLKNGGA